MAVNTQNKRASAISYLTPWGAVYPDPDGSLTSQADRQQISGLYAGLTTTTESEVTCPATLTGTVSLKSYTGSVVLGSYLGTVTLKTREGSICSSEIIHEYLLDSDGKLILDSDGNTIQT